MTDEMQVTPGRKPSSELSTSHKHPAKLRALLLVLAVVFAAATVVYSFAWMYYIRWQTRVELGIETEDVMPRAMEITQVHPDSPAEHAGLRAHDLIIAINEQDLATADATFVRATWFRGKPGDDIRLTVRRPGQPESVQARAVFGAAKDTTSTPKRIAQQ